MKITKSKINSLLNLYKQMKNPIITATKTKIVLFKNTKKTTEAQPYFNGFVIQGEKDNEQKYKVTLWEKVSKAGGKYLNGSIDFTQLAEEKPKATAETEKDELFKD